MERSGSLIPRYAFQVLSIVDLAESISEHYNQTRDCSARYNLTMTTHHHIKDMRKRVLCVRM